MAPQRTSSQSCARQWGNPARNTTDVRSRAAPLRLTDPVFRERAFYENARTDREAKPVASGA